MENSSNFDINDYDFKFNTTSSEKSYNKTLLLIYFLGIFGAHRFYTGKTITGLIMLVTLGGLGIWTFIDLITLLKGSFKDKNGLLIKADTSTSKGLHSHELKLLIILSLIFNIVISSILLNKTDLTSATEDEDIALSNNQITLVKRGKAQYRADENVYAYNVDPILEVVLQENGGSHLSFPPPDYTWTDLFEYSDDSSIYITTEILENVDVENACTADHLENDFKIVIYGQEVTENGCSVVYDKLHKTSRESLYMYAIEVTYIEETNTYIRHYFEGYKLSDEDFVNIVCQTFDTTKLKES